MASISQPPTAPPSRLKPNFIYVLRAPGSSRGTLCKMLGQHHKCAHVSVGDHLRFVAEEELPSTITGGVDPEEIRCQLESHELMEPWDIVNILRAKIDELTDKGVATVILDGFPKERISADLFASFLGYRPMMVLLLDCPKEVAQKRFLQREKDTTDSAEVFEKQYADYEKNSKVLAELYSDILRTVDISGTILESWKKLKKAVLEGFPRVLSCD